MSWMWFALHGTIAIARAPACARRLGEQSFSPIQPRRKAARGRLRDWIFLRRLLKKLAGKSLVTFSIGSAPPWNSLCSTGARAFHAGASGRCTLSHQHVPLASLRVTPDGLGETNIYSMILRFGVAYCFFVALPLLGCVEVLEKGRAMPAPHSVEGIWNVEAKAGELSTLLCGRSPSGMQESFITITQSGKNLVLRLNGEQTATGSGV